MTAISDLTEFKANLNYPPELPIVERRLEIIEAIKENQVVVLAGETGSGKSTQLPKLCVEAGRGVAGIIGHTQPRRIAARAVAERICQETNTSLGQNVGFTVRFNDRVGPNTRIKVMTDGILLAELQSNRKLKSYDTIIIDEAHERSLNIDFILGYLKQLLPQRSDLKLIITSATIDTERIAAHFSDQTRAVPIIEVSGRQYPVEIRYRPYQQPKPDPSAPEALSQVEAIIAAVDELVRQGPGDILVFLAGERDIRETAEALKTQTDIEILPLYARLSSSEQLRVFRPGRKRRIVLATNVAETAVTVPAIRYLIDCGTARIARYNKRTKIQRLPIEDISKASADQRSGRCGRIGPGICIRLYSQQDYDNRAEFTQPEVLRTNLGSVALQLGALGLGSIEQFSFIDPPDHAAIADGIRLLEELGAVDPEYQNSKRWLTPVGKQLAKLPIDPRFAAMILKAAQTGALHEVLVIVAALSTRDPREYPTEEYQQALSAHAKFIDEDSDFITLLNLWKYLTKQRKTLSSNQFRKRCRSEYLNYQRVREWFDLQRQLRELCQQMGHRTSGNAAEPATVHQALLAGLLSQIGQRELNKQKPKNSAAKSKSQPSRPYYIGARGTKFNLSRRSVLAKKNPPWVMAAELMETDQLWASMVGPIQAEWVESMAEHLLSHSYDSPTWNPEHGVAYCNETVRLYGLVIVANRKLSVAKVNPKLARELFIHHALIEHQWDGKYSFSEHNKTLIAEMAEIETRLRRDLLIENQKLYDFFDQRIPAEIVSATHFAKWWRETKPDKLLKLSQHDLLESGVENIDLNDFPSLWTVEPGLELELAYQFDQTSHLDGLSIHVPIELLQQLKPAPFSWTVPGLRNELLNGLIRSLEKQTRKKFNPISETIESIKPELDQARAKGTAIDQALATALSSRVNPQITTAQFNWAKVPDYCQATFRVLNPDRELLAEGKNLESLQKLMATKTQQAVEGLAADKPGLNKTMLEWEVGDLAAEVILETNSHPVTAYPAICDDGKGVVLRYLTSPESQADAHWDGVRRLLRIGLNAPLKTLDKLFSNETKLKLLRSAGLSKAIWYDDTISCALDQIMEHHGSCPLSEAGFKRLETSAKKQFGHRLAELAEQAEQLIGCCHELDQRFNKFANASSFEASLADAQAHYQRLVYPGFMIAAGADRLTDIARYLQALSYRLERMPELVSADLLKAAELVELEKQYRQAVERIGNTDELVAIFYLIEELRVVSFAQHLRSTQSGKISVKRITGALQAAS